jgi:hypothetical protein
MALDSYTNLQTAVTTWLARADITSDQVKEFIRLAEEQISFDIAQCSFMQTTPAAISMSGSTFTLPATANSLISARLVELDQPLNIVGAAELKREASNFTGPPRDCAITGATDAGLLTVTVWPDPDATYTIKATYSQSLPPLSGSLAANFVLTRAPSLYLYGSLLASEAFISNDRRLPTWQALYSQALERFRGLGWDGDAMLSTDIPVTNGRASTIFSG